MSCRDDAEMLIELSYAIGPRETVMEAGLKPPAITARSRLAAGRHSNTSYIELFAHAGTHIDTPWHFNESGRKIMGFAIEDFVFSRVLLLDVPSGAREPVPLTSLEPHEEKIRSSDAVLIRTGFGPYRTSDPITYVDATPGLSVGAAQFLARFRELRCVGVDCISIENVKQGREIGFPVHHVLLDRPEPMLLLEDANLAALKDHTVSRLWLLPLRMVDLEASPVTAVAEVGNENAHPRITKDGP